MCENLTQSWQALSSVPGVCCCNANTSQINIDNFSRLRSRPNIFRRNAITVNSTVNKIFQFFARRHTSHFFQHSAHLMYPLAVDICSSVDHDKILFFFFLSRALFRVPHSHLTVKIAAETSFNFAQHFNFRRPTANEVKEAQIKLNRRKS